MNVVRMLAARSLDEGGAVLAEYALILGLLSLASVSVLSLMGGQATASLQNTTSVQLQYEQTPP
jgi:Flp pilus assembly pilin Flp